MSRRLPADPFAILGLAPGADWPSIRHAYRQRVREVHPDVRGGSFERFVEVREAYEALRDPQARWAWERASRREPRPAPEPLVPGDEVIDLRVRARAPAAAGLRTVALELHGPCEVCGGGGVVARYTCPHCGGEGRVRQVVRARVALPPGARHGEVRRLRFHVDGFGVVELDARLLLA